MNNRLLLALVGISLSLLSSFDKVAPINGHTINGQKFMVVLIPSYNNRAWCRMNLGQLFEQQYDNYHVVYMDDASTDGTGEIVQKYIKECGQEHRVTYIRQEQNYGAAYNLYHGAHLCCNNAIIITYDGDDWFKRSDALQIINRAYDDKDVWMTWGQFQVFPIHTLGQCAPMPEHVIQEKSYRHQYWITSHVRTYYAGLFKQIKREDFMHQDEFYPIAADLAVMYPLLEMANGHFKFIETPLYMYNLFNPLNDCRINCGKQEYYGELIRNKPKYESLSVEQARTLFLYS